MKKLFRTLLMVVVLIGSFNICFAQDSVHIKPRYLLYATNFAIASNSVEFDIRIRQRADNADSTQFRYAAGQYFLQFNLAFAAGGTLTYSIVSSELDPPLRPINPTVFQNQLRLATNLPSLNNIAVIDTIGKVIVRMRLANTVPWNQADTMNLRWKSVAPAPFTKISAFTGQDNTVLTEIQDAASNFVDFPTGINGPDPVTSLIPTEFSMSQNYPNPFNPTTKIDYAIPTEGQVNIKVFDITGRQVMNLVNEVKPAGFHSINFNGSDLASGMYFYRIDVVSGGQNKFQTTRRMVLIK